MNNSQIFSQRLKELRDGESAISFAKRVGINNPSTYHNYEKTGRIPKNHEIIERICEVCGVSEAWLLGYSDEYTKSEYNPHVVNEEKAEYRIKGERIYPYGLEKIDTKLLEKFIQLALSERNYAAIQVLSSELENRQKKD